MLQLAHFLLALLLFNFPSLGAAGINGLNLRFELNHLVRLSSLLSFQFGNSSVEIGHTVLCLDLFPHGKRPRTLVECLICSDGHLDLIPNPEEQKPTLRLVQADLSDDLIEALREKFLPNWADAALSCLSLHELLVEHLSEASNIHSRGRLVTHVLNVMFA